ncbi:MAG: hypothetical protein RQ729_06300 [Wenzhouxiangellaceae bacterium]|nr:hypothetical protein [Wenzhouxiangellaceae bacterium]
MNTVCFNAIARSVSRPGWMAFSLGLLMLSVTLPLSAGIRLDQQAGGRLGGIAEDHNGHLHIAQGLRIHTLALDDDGRLRRAGLTDPFEGMVTDIAVQGERLYAIVSGFDGSNPDAIAILRIGTDGQLEIETLFAYSDDEFSRPEAIAVNESTMFVLDSELGLLSFDLSGSGKPEQIAAEGSLGGLFDAGIELVDQQRLAIWGLNGLGNLVFFIADISDPASPLPGPALQASGAFDVVVDNETLVLVGAEVTLFNIDGLQLEPLAVLPETMAFTAARDAETLLLPRFSFTGQPPAIEVWSLADPSAPVRLGETPSDLFGTGLRFGQLEIIDGGRRAVHLAVDGSARLIDLSDPAAALERDRLFLPGSVDAHATVEVDGVLHVLDIHAGVHRVNPALALRDFTRLGQTGNAFTDFPVAEDMAGDGDLLLIADWAQGVHVMRRTDDGPPEPVSFVPFEFVASVAVDGRRAWAVSSTEGASPPAMISIDLSDPAAPRVTGTTTLAKGTRVLYRDGFVYVLDQGQTGNGQGLMVFRPDEQGVPELLTAVSPCGDPVDLSVQSGIAAVACQFDGVFLYKLARGATPALLGHWPGTEGALINTVGLDGPRLWVGDTRGVALLDIRNPAEPVLVDRISAPGLIQGARLRPAAAGGMWLSGTQLGILRLSDDRLMQPGQTAAWFDPDRNGEGWQIEILDARRALGYWFTYDESGNPRWLLGVGDIEGLRIDFRELMVTSGPTFGSGFDPDDLVMEVAGSASFEFTACDRGRYSFDAFGEQMELPLIKLSRSMLIDCRPRAESISDRRAMQTGSWFSPERSGQGFTLQWLDDARALMTWFTYDERGEQFWIQAQGRLQGDEIRFEDAVATRGPRFGTGFDANALEILPWGRILLRLECRTGHIEYDSTLPQFGRGSHELSRLTVPAGLECPAPVPPSEEPAS